MQITRKTFLLFLLLVTDVIPVQIQLQEGEELDDNKLQGSQLNKCLSERRGAEVGVCFGKELLSNLNQYDEAESFTLATGVTFVRDEKTPREFGNFLDKDPMDYRYIFYPNNILSDKSSNIEAMLRKLT